MYVGISVAEFGNKDGEERERGTKCTLGVRAGAGAGAGGSMGFCTYWTPCAHTREYSAKGDKLLAVLLGAKPHKTQFEAMISCPRRMEKVQPILLPGLSRMTRTYIRGPRH